MIRYWTFYRYGSIIANRINDDEDSYRYSLCKKIIIFSDKDVDIFCINSVDIYRTTDFSFNISHQFKVRYGGEFDMLFRLEESIAKEIADAIVIPHNAKYICFSDVHGDVCLLSIVLFLHQKTDVLIIDCGDLCHPKNDLWTGYEMDENERNARDRYCTYLYKLFYDDRFICLCGNHDNRSDIMVVADGKYMEIIFHHAFIKPRVAIERYKTLDYRGDKLTFYRYVDTKPMYHVFYHSTGGRKMESITHLRNRIRQFITKQNYFIICGHDNNYFYLSHCLDNKFPQDNVVTHFPIGESIYRDSDDPLKHVINTDGLPYLLWDV